MALALNADPTRDVFIGRAASEQQVRSMNLSGYRIVAFAKHPLSEVFDLYPDRILKLLKMT